MTEPRPEFPQVEGFTITGFIDRGGFSIVYEATQHVLDRSVAIKVLNASFEDQRQRVIFERECRAMGRLSTHQNIVTVIAPVFTTDGLPGIVMEQYRGTLRNEGTLPVLAILDVGAKIADALQAIHDVGITHRDIKPHNIFVSDRHEPAIGDFGISSISDEGTVTGGAGFSINYAPPEVFEEGGADQQGDLYSLGATLYHLASGEVPFPYHGAEDDRMRATVQRIIQSPPPMLDVEGAPPELGRLLKRCMAKSPADRPASADAIARDLRKMLNALGGPPHTPSLRAWQPLATTSEPAPIVEPTIVRPGSSPTPSDDAPTPAVNAEEQRSANERPRKIVLLVAAAIIALIGLVGVTLGTLGGSDDQSTPSTISTSIPIQADFEVLTAPTDVEVTSVGDGIVRISWSTEDPAWKVQITEIGSDRSEITHESPFEWTSDDAGSGCFELRTVNAGETRLSQVWAGPDCA